MDEVCVSFGYEFYLCVCFIGYKGGNLEVLVDKVFLCWIIVKMV